ncbi:hypothetical protein AMELA_G00214740 [Ameiurus melas]|uniref:Uncharacterized protein n=1 Tax=Ameiurus melas TaxID=219545 RepID=A0A7J6A2H6_AMEME|nr:hypothetical protein AMELA_G00214740 [Ameiurus melas]
MCVYSGGVTLIYWYLVALILLLVIIACVLRKKYKNQIRTRDRSNDTTVHTAESEGSYSSIAFKSRKKKSEARNLEQSSASTDSEQDVTYSFVNIASKNKTKFPKDVGDETIYSSVVY